MIQYPTIEQYKEELRPFVEKGWQVAFQNDEEAQTSLLQVAVPDLEFYWHIHLSEVELTHPHLVPLFIERVRDRLAAEFRRDYNLPQLRIYSKSQSVAYEPTDWVEFRSFLGLATFKPDTLNKEEFRRFHQIVLASPFTDYFQQRIYELDYIDIGLSEPVRMIRDDSTGYWYLWGSDNIRRDAALVTQGTRLSSTY